MLIRVIITIITLLLLFNEYFQVLDKVKKRNRKKIILLILLVLSILSIVDVVNEVNDGNELIEKANNLVIKSNKLISNTDSIIVDLKKNIISVEDASKSIESIDLVLKNVEDSVASQVNILKSVVNKSKELIKLEGQRFEQDKANVMSFERELILDKINSDSILVSIKYRLSNKGKRNAIDMTLTNKLFFYNDEKDRFTLVNLNNDDVLTTEIESNTSLTQSYSYSMEVENIETIYDRLVLIILCEYKDDISMKKMEYKECFIVKNLKNKNSNFFIQNSAEFQKKINTVLIASGNEKYIINE